MLGPVRVGPPELCSLARVHHVPVCSEGQPHTPISGQVFFYCEGISPWLRGKGRTQNATMYHV